MHHLVELLAAAFEVLAGRPKGDVSDEARRFDRIGCAVVGIVALLVAVVVLGILGVQAATEQ